MKFKALALGCALLAGNASASVLINFEGMTPGAMVNDYYNGGTNSLGESGGPNYGISMYGFTVKTDSKGNHYAAGDGASVLYGSGNGFSFARRSDISSIALDAVGADPFGDLQSYAYDGFRMVDAKTFGGVSVSKGPNGQWIYGAVEDAIHAFTWGGLDIYTLTGFSLGLVYLDNLFIDAPSWIAAAVNTDPDSTVPEPGSIALLGLGAVGLLGARRRKSVSSKNA